MINEEAIEILKTAEFPEDYTVEEVRQALDMAIKTLSAEKTTINPEKTTITDGDLISRQAIIDLLNKLIEVEQKQGTDVMNYGRERVNAYESILDEIESDYLFPSMPSAEKTAKWISVSERLPEKMGTYLVTLEYKEHGIGVTTLWFHGAEIGWDLRVADIVLAWMPLPEPYKVEEGK